MLRASHLLLMLSVLWCGLHLSPAEVDAPFGTADAEVALHDREEGNRHGDDRSDHDLPHAAQACHNHCPMAPDQAERPGISPPAPAAAAPFATSARKLTSLSQAPPVQPPAA